MHISKGLIIFFRKNRWIFFGILILAIPCILFFQTRTRLSQKALPALFPVLEHKPFVILIPSYNNEAWIDKNLTSALFQKYDNFRIVYINDASTDRTEEKITPYLTNPLLTYQKNGENRGALANLYHAIHQCDDDEIVVLLDGDDWLSHEHVLERLNEVYADPDVWMTCGNYLRLSRYSLSKGEASGPIPPKVIEKNSLRQYVLKKYPLSHLKTFYSALFKKIPLKDLCIDGRFIDPAGDVAMMVPLAEMAAHHYRHIKDILYIYNHTSPLHDDRIRWDQQLENTRLICSNPPYLPLKSLFPLSEDPSFDQCMGKGTPAWEYLKTPEDRKRLQQVKKRNLQPLLSPAVPIPNLFHWIWLGPKPFPPSSLHHLQQWIEKHPEAQFKLWTDRPHPEEISLEPLPQTIALCPFEQFPLDVLPGFRNCYSNADSFREKSEILRLAILVQEGGVYIDHDVEPLCSLDSLQQQFSFFCGLEKLQPTLLSSSVFLSSHLIGAIPYHPTLYAAGEWLVAHWDRLENQFPGSDESSILYRLRHRGARALDYSYFHLAPPPPPYRIFPSAYFSHNAEAHPLLAIHHHAHSWRSSDPTLASRSLLSQIEEKWGISWRFLLGLTGINMGLLFLLLRFLRKKGLFKKAAS